MKPGEYKQKSGGENHEIRIMEHRGGRSENRRGSAARYLLDAISVAPEKKRPAVTSVPGGGYARRSDREAEPVILQFLSMGYHGFLLDYSVAPNRFPTSVRELALAVSMVREHAEEWHVDPEKDLCLWIFRQQDISAAV